MTSAAQRPHLVTLPVSTRPDDVATLVGALEAAMRGEIVLRPVASRPHVSSDHTIPPPEPIPPDPVPTDLPDGAAIILDTSGSTTGHPQHVALSAAALRASAEAAHAHLGGPGRWLLALPPHHVAGIQVLLRSALAGHAPAVLDLTDGFDPAAFADAASRTRQESTATRLYTSLVPTQLARVIDTGHGPSLARFDAILVGGAPASPALLEEARGGGARIVTTYGMTETCGGCVYDGIPLDGVLIAIGDRGRIHIGGATLALGYVALDVDPHVDSESAHHHELDILDALGSEDGGPGFHHGWLRTGDVGELTAPDDGAPRLRVLGRLDDVIITGGVNVSPHAVEAVLHGDPAIAQVIVVGVPDAQWGQLVVAVVVPSSEREPQLDELRTRAREALDGTHAPRALVLVDAIPERGPGKPDRRATAGLAAARLSERGGITLL